MSTRVLTLFNHKGGVGKTTLTVNLADAFADLGETVLIVDADPQCNMSAFYLKEDDLDGLLGESTDADEGQTIWSALKPVVLGRGTPATVNTIPITEKIHLLVGDVLLSQYEEELPLAWTESFARKPRGYDVMCALSRVARAAAEEVDATLIMYDVGPNVGPLNRTVLLDSDFFITPVHTDLYSLRALTTVGASVSRWISDWKTVRSLASASTKSELLEGEPKYLGYLASAYQTYGGRKARPHEYWERMLPPRVKSKVVDQLRSVNPALAPESPYKVGDVPDFHSVAASAQEFGLPVGKLRGYVNSGHYPAIDEWGAKFKSLAAGILKRMEK